ncbi:MAG: GDP-mannose 4,6-dehydratase, partial [Rubrivivax sp.]|nr:GDP-mannose 4,6-dehydratase [Rubrivivax sp.]
DQAEDFVIATGVQVSVRQFVQMAAAELGIELVFEGQGEREVGRIDKLVESRQGGDHRAKVKPGEVIVRVDPRYFRPTEVETLLGDASKAKQKLGWSPKTTLAQLVAEMVRSDYEAARRDSLVKLAGFKAYDYNE